MNPKEGASVPPPAGEPAGTIRDIVGVRSHPTVVRLDDLERDDAAWITRAYCLTPEVESHLRSLRNLLAEPAGRGAFVIGQYGAGKSHFLAYSAQALRTGTLVAAGPDVAVVSLVNFRAETPLEEAVSGALGVEVRSGDRRAAWSALAGRHPRGVVLLVDELSEFLRAKPDRRRFNEDARFLQFLGEWAAGNRFWVLAAMQEQIEHAGDLEYDIYRKIKDRYPIRYLLTPAHVRDLIRDGILVKRPDYDAAVDSILRDVKRALPGVPLDEAGFRAFYPIHPATLELLEEVRESFSAARGAIDFAVARLAGDPARGVGAFLDRPLGEVLAPDAIVDHFADLFEIQPEFLPLAEHVLPYYRKRLPELFPEPALRALAERILKLLALVHVSPRRAALGAGEAIHWLLLRASRLEPERNQGLVERVLRRLCEEGRFVVADGGGYRLDLAEGGRAEVDRLLEREQTDLAAGGEMVFEELRPLLEAEIATPFGLARESWQTREVRWHFHPRRYAVYLGREEPPSPPDGGPALCIRLPWGPADAAPGAFTLRPARLALGAEVVELAAALRLLRRAWGADARQRLEGRVRDRLGLLRAAVRNAYLDAEVADPAGRVEPAPRVDPSLALPKWIDGIAEWTLRRVHPSFERFAPSHGPLPKEAYRALARAALESGGFVEEEADDYVKLVREAYLVPMGLLERKGRGYAVPARLESHELSKLVLGMLEQHPAPRVVYERLAAPVYGLVADQVALLLVSLVVRGDVDLVKGTRSFRDLYETLPNPLHYDRVVAGRGLPPDKLRDLERLATGLGLRAPGQWTVAAERQIVRKLREIGRAECERLQGLLVRLEEFGEAREMAGSIERALAAWRVLGEVEDEIRALEQFLFETGSPARFLALHSGLRGISERLERLLGEVRRHRHLLGHPALAAAGSPLLAKLREGLEALGDPPPLGSGEAADRLLEDWLGRARALYGSYEEEYRRRHADWWREWGTHPRLQWAPPNVARSRHLGLAAELGEIASLRAALDRERCRGLVDMSFQPVCACGFEGESAPVAERGARLDRLRERVETELRLFFGQERVRLRLAAWVAEGFEHTSGTDAYLSGDAAYPDVGDVALLDRHLAGVDLVIDADPRPILDLLGERAWEPAALADAFRTLLSRYGDSRVRFASAAGDSRERILAWAAEQSLRFEVPLPDGLGAADRAVVAAALRPEWASPAALAGLEALGFPEAAEERIAGWILDGTIPPPDGKVASPLVSAALSTLRPVGRVAAEELGRRAAALYGQHPRMMRIAPERWLATLGEVAAAPLAAPLPSLPDVLAASGDAAWLVIDALGAPLAATFLGGIDDFLPDWRLESASWAEVGAGTTTDAFYRSLAEAGTRHPFEKVNAIDSLLHERFPDFEDLCRLAAAELAIGCRAARRRLDPGRALLVFADHGFRIAPEGRSYVHGGASTLERIVPVVRLVPR